MVTNTGSTALALRSYSWGLNATPGIINGGTVTHSFLSRDASLAGFGAVSASFTAATNHIRGTMGANATAGNEVVLPFGVPLRVASMRVSNPAGFPNNFNPFLPATGTAMQLVTAGGKTQCVTTCWVNYDPQASPVGQNFTINSPLNAASGTNLNVLTGVMSPSPTGPAPFILNPPAGCTPVITNVSETACDSYTWSAPAGNGNTYTTSGVYANAIPQAGNPSCFDTTYLNLTINYSTTSTENQTACDSYTWAQNGVTYTASGTYNVLGTNGQGCPDTHILELVINNSTSSTDDITACDSYTWSANGVTYTASGTATTTSLNAAGCTHTSNLNVTVNYSSSSSVSETACDSYTWNGTTYNASGAYTHTSLNASGCVHTETLNLTINNSTSSSMSETACDSYTWNGTTYNASGSYTMTSLNAAGCTHTETLNLTINNSTSASTSETACDSYTWNGTTYNASGTYTMTSLNAAGCTHTETLNLTINNSTSASTSETACDSYTWNGTTYNASGSYTMTSLNAAGCTHTETLNLTINNSSSNSTNETACGTYTWAVDGNTYTMSGTYTATSLNAAGCTHTETLNLTITPLTGTTTNETVCDSYTWASNGATYTASGTYSNPTSCGTDVLNLTVNYSSSSASSETACDSYTWNGTTYNASGTYTHTSLNAAGCTHTETLNLTINNSTSASTSETACDSYTWNGTTYNASGSYTMTSLNAAGCTHTETLNLTINNSTTSTEDMTACDSYTWACNGTSYNASGSYTCTSLNAAGCVNTATLNLTINNSTSASTSETACDSYTWNGTTYNASGSYTMTSLNAAGCTHTETLNLTINNSTSASTSETACDSYTWNGTTYNASGSYTMTSLNAAGCTHTETLNLTINNSTTSTEDVTACDSYTWACNGASYNATGSYTCTSLNAAGCVNTATLNLHIDNSSSSSSSETACDSYTWAQNGVTYTASGAYVAVGLNAQGCTYTHTLNLTINNSSSNTTNASAAGSYTWAVNGQTYFASGTYTETSLNAAGCVHTETLNLIITGSGCSFTLSVIEDQPISCFGNTDASLQATASPSGTYTYTVVSPDASTSSNQTGYFDQLMPGTHTVYTTDGGCTTSGTIFFLEPDPLAITLVTDSMVSCLGNDGQLTACITGGTNILQGYLTWWTNAMGDTLNDVLTNNFALTLGNLSAGNYNVSIEDDRGCFFDSTQAILVAAPITTTPNFAPIACHGGSTVVTPTGTGGVMYVDALGNSPSCADPNAASVSTLTYMIDGAPVAASYAAGTYTLTATDAKGCSASTVFTIADPAMITGSSSETACDTYSWNGNTYTNSGMYTGTFVAANGCDSVHTLDLTINYSTTSTEDATACDSYTWSQNGVTYTTSGTYTAVGTNTQGCPDTHILNLTINYSTSSTETAAACDSYTWTLNGVTYTVSGLYTATSMNAAGCTHTTTLDLTINTATSSTEDMTACDSYTWNGNTYTTSGTYTATYLNAAGCAHTATLNLTINYSTSSTTSYLWCDMYTWPVSGQTYTASGVYSHTSLNAAGCTHTDYLNLTINHTTVTVICCVTACDSYTWAQNGVTYTASGSYYFIGQNASGCPDVYTLCLEIFNSTSSTVTASACDTYTWALNGATYTASGMYTATSLNASGCTHTTTLDLTINNSTSSTESATACDSYTWNGTTYTTSGVYTATSLNAAGCTHTTTLDLTVNYSTTSNESETACDSYTWKWNNIHNKWHLHEHFYECSRMYKHQQR